jgi:hypothetical protein
MTDDKRDHAWALGIAAQAWCEPSTSSIEMDDRLAEAFAHILLRELLAASPTPAPAPVEPVATITELGEVMVPHRGEFQAMFDALPEVPNGGIKTIEVYTAPPASTGIEEAARVAERNRCIRAVIAISNEGGDPATCLSIAEELRCPDISTARAALTLKERT